MRENKEGRVEAFAMNVFHIKMNEPNNNNETTIMLVMIIDPAIIVIMVIKVTRKFLQLF